MINRTPERLLITGANGNVGLKTLRELMKSPSKAQFEVLAGRRNPAKSTGKGPLQADRPIALDFEDTTTFDAALSGVSRVLLVRPPQLADVNKFFAPFIDAMKRAGVRQVVFLSLQGVDNNPVTPHHKIEKLIRKAGLPFTFLQPSFFMQNLSTTHRDEIRLRNELFIPAGNGRTSFIDVRDIAAVAALVLTDKTGKFINKSYELTGSEALTYTEVAQILSDVLGRTIIYKNPSILRFIWQKWQHEHQPLGFIMIMAALYTVSKLGKAAGLTNTTEQLLHRSPLMFRQFAQDFRADWLP